MIRQIFDKECEDEKIENILNYKGGKSIMSTWRICCCFELWNILARHIILLLLAGGKHNDTITSEGTKRYKDYSYMNKYEQRFIYISWSNSLGILTKNMLLPLGILGTKKVNRIAGRKQSFGAQNIKVMPGSF